MDNNNQQRKQDEIIRMAFVGRVACNWTLELSIVRSKSRRRSRRYATPMNYKERRNIRFNLTLGKG